MIYFYGSDDGTAVKIGVTGKTARSRRISHEGHGPGRQRLQFLAGVYGKPSDEKAVHRYFRHLLMPGEVEWFYPKDELVGYIRWLRNEWYVSLDENDPPIDQVTADRWRPSPERYVTQPGQGDLFAGAWAVVSLPETTGDDWYTSEVIIERARTVMGGVTLDPASHPLANKKIRADRFYTASTNGLLREWSGRVWLNPPFSGWKEWRPKICQEWVSGRIDQMCVLMESRTLTSKTNARVLSACSGLCITTGRIPFWGPNTQSAPQDGHAILYFGPNLARFAEEFSSIGIVFNLFGAAPPSHHLALTTTTTNQETPS